MNTSIFETWLCITVAVNRSLELVINPLCAQANSASDPQRDMKQLI